MTEEEVKKDLRRFFEILDTKEESDSGKTFMPVYISSCRALLTAELGQILPRLKSYAQS